MTEHMKTDFKEAEIEPTPAPPDNYCSKLPFNRVQIRYRPPPKLDKRRLKPLSSMNARIGVTPFRRKSTVEFSLGALPSYVQRNSSTGWQVQPGSGSKRDGYISRRHSTMGDIALMAELK